MRLSPVEAATQYVAAAHPGCLLAVLGGSAARQAHGPDSDLDIVVVERGESDLFRKVVRFRGWVVGLPLFEIGEALVARLLHPLESRQHLSRG